MENLKYVKGRPMTHGMAVTIFQKLGEEIIGQDFLENDGWFGSDSMKLAIEVQNVLGLPQTGIVDDATWTAMFQKLGRNSTGAKEYIRDGVKVIDGRDIWTPVKKFYGVLRGWEDLSTGKPLTTGIMLHQTGCWMPEDPLVWNQLNAHVGITRKGVIILMFPFEMQIWHGNGLSDETIGVEIAGLFRGIEGKENTHFPKKATPDTFGPEQQKACDILFEIFNEEFRAHGGRIKNIYAHRQSDDDRMSDPGEAIWKGVALKWLEILGATDGGPDFKVDSGLPIPTEWNPSYPHSFWG